MMRREESAYNQSQFGQS